MNEILPLIGIIVITSPVWIAVLRPMPKDPEW
jgi:hypothetical protein